MDKAAAFIAEVYTTEKACSRILKYFRTESRGHGAEAGERVRIESTVPKDVQRKRYGPAGLRTQDLSLIRRTR